MVQSEGLSKRLLHQNINWNPTVDGGSGKISVLPFTNIYDKRYGAMMIDWKYGAQKVLQPEWAKSDKRFRRDQTLLSASVAMDRGGNERAVNVCKRAWFVSRGFLPNMSPKQLNEAWTTWSFQQSYEQWALEEGLMGCFVVCGGGKWWGVALNKSHHVGDNDYQFNCSTDAPPFVIKEQFLSIFVDRA
jgi:hypothetical protein